MIEYYREMIVRLIGHVCKHQVCTINLENEVWLLITADSLYMRVYVFTYTSKKKKNEDAFFKGSMALQ